MDLHQRREAKAWAAVDETGTLGPFSLTRRSTGPDDIAICVKYCGICHTDLHFIRNEWKNTKYPVVPGHEIVGVVTNVGQNVSEFQSGDRVGVGLLAWSCQNCDACEKEQQQYCEKKIWCYNDTYIDGEPTYGGFSTSIVMDRRYVVHIPENLPLDVAAPLLCAGITMYSPMKHFGMTEAGKHFGVVGLGGLGHIAVKFAKAFNMEVTVISTSASKEEEAKKVLGADHFLVSTDDEQMKKAAKTMDYIIDTVSVAHPLDNLLSLLKVNGKLVLVGLPVKPLELLPASVIFGRRLVAGSLIGGIRETQEMLDFCGKQNVQCTIEKIPMDYVNTAMERLAKSDVKYRFVIDVAGSLSIDTQGTKNDNTGKRKN